MKADFHCKNCGGKIEHNLLIPSSLAKCPYCQKEFIIVKNVGMMTIELIFLFVVALGVRAILGLANTTLNIVIELFIVIALLFFLNIVFDVFFTKVIKYNGYFSLMERKDVKEIEKKRLKK